MIANKAGRTSAKEILENSRLGSGGRSLSALIKLPEGIELWEPKARETYRLNIYPYRNNKGKLQAFRDFNVHFNVGPSKAMCISPKSFGQPDTISDMARPIWEQWKETKDIDKRKKLMEKIREFEGQLFRAYVIKHPETGKFAVYIASYGKFAKPLKEELSSYDEADPRQYFFMTGDGSEDSEAGYTIRVKFIEKQFAKKTFLEGKVLEFKQRKPEDLDEILSNAPCLDDIFVVPTTEELRALEEGEDLDDEETPKKKGHAKASRDDEDDDDDFDDEPDADDEEEDEDDEPDADDEEEDEDDEPDDDDEEEDEDDEPDENPAKKGGGKKSGKKSLKDEDVEDAEPDEDDEEEPDADDEEEPDEDDEEEPDEKPAKKGGLKGVAKVGDVVAWDDEDGDEAVGTLISINAAGHAAMKLPDGNKAAGIPVKDLRVKVAKSDKKVAKAEESEEDAGGEDTEPSAAPAFKKGDKVLYSDGDKRGVVIAVAVKGNTVKIRNSDGEIETAPFDDVSLRQIKPTPKKVEEDDIPF